MPTIGYGEDGLTYHALHAGRGDLLAKLEDPTLCADCTVYFRPSFGRGPSPLFGEFDAILCACDRIYLIECKWNNGDAHQTSVDLPVAQRRRHRVFTWLYENWCVVFANGGEPTWATFFRAREHAFAHAFPGRQLAKEEHLLARNLTRILTDITERQRELHNVLLFFYPQSLTGEVRISMPDSQPVEPDFRLVMMLYEPIGASRYFQMAD
jgi:hypothetical protein